MMASNTEQPDKNGTDPQSLEPKPDTGQAIEFLQRMHPDGTWHLVAVDSSGKITSKTFGANQVNKMEAWIDARQGEQNIYFHVNSLRSGVADVKAKKADVKAAQFLHVDIDDITACDKIAAFKPLPTVVIFSGGGYQAFWRLDQPSEDLDAVERANVTLARELGGDNCHNVDRIMRLPGTINVPNEKKRKKGRRPALAHIIPEQTDWTRAYPLTAFRQSTIAQAKSQLTLGDEAIKPVGVDDLPSGVSDFIRQLITHGDDPQRPIGSPNAHYPSRSEPVFRVACELLRAGCDDRTIAGVLLNRDNGISVSILEKRNPRAYALRQIRSAREAVGDGWPDITKSGQPRPTLRNTMVGMRRLGLRFENDAFHRRKSIAGHQLQSFIGELSDDGCATLRHIILSEFGFDPGKDNTREAANILCLDNTYHPIGDYLDRLRWDLKPRIQTWLAAYLGAEDTALNQEIGKIMLVAAVRRIRQPGVKFDTIVVLEGKQGTGKSSALRILAGDENFSDQDILTLDAKTQIEAMEGVWIYELCELEGLSRADTNRVKAFASRSIDRARAAYARFREDRPRQNIFVGTTNDDKYLRDLTGNRRFWPVRTGAIDLNALSRDRDQLWAEAAYWEAKDEPINLSEDLWPAAAREQEARLEEDPWLDILAKVKGEPVGQYERISTAKIFSIQLLLGADRLQQYHTKRLAQNMRKLGWEGPQPMKMPDGTTQRGYQRGLSENDELPDNDEF